MLHLRLWTDWHGKDIHDGGSQGVGDAWMESDLLIADSEVESGAEQYPGNGCALLHGRQPESRAIEWCKMRMLLFFALAWSDSFYLLMMVMATTLPIN